MPGNIIEEYLVKIGFSEDAHSFRQFESVLKDAEQAVERHTSGMMRTLLKAQAGILGAFTGIATGILGVVDKVAQADQSYRLFGLRLMLTTDSARKLKMATDALGQPLENLIWDPELHARAMVMFHDIDHMQEQLGPQFEERMRRIRDIRFEFTRLGLALKFLGMEFASSLFAKFGLTIDQVAVKLNRFVGNLQNRLPAIADRLADHAIPILKQTWFMFVSLGGAIKEFGALFTTVVGILSGDTSIEGAAFSFEKFGKAIEHVVHAGGVFFQWITLAEKMLIHFANAIALVISGRFKDAASELKASFADLTAGSAAIFGIPLGAAIGGAAGTALGTTLGAALGSVVPGIGTTIGAAIGGTIGAGVGGTVGTGVGAVGGGFAGYGLGALKEGLLPSASQDLIPVIEAMAQKYGVPSSLALAVAKTESGIRQYDSSGKLIDSGKALGVMQLAPRTARDLGVNPSDPAQNIEGGNRYLRQLLDRYQGNEALALAAYNAGPGAVDRALKNYGPNWLSALPRETRNYVPSVLKYEAQFAQSPEVASKTMPPQVPAAAAPSIVQMTAPTPDSPAMNNAEIAWNYMRQPAAPMAPTTNNTSQHVSIDIGGVYITQPGADERQIQRAVENAGRNMLRRQTQFDLAQVAPAW